MTFLQMREIVLSSFPDYNDTLVKMDLNMGHKDFASKTGLPRKSYNIATNVNTTAFAVPKRIYGVVTNGVMTTFEYVGFTAAPTYVVAGTGFTISSNGELDLEGMIFSNDYSMVTVGIPTTSNLQVQWTALAGKTISFIWQNLSSIDTGNIQLTNEMTYVLNTDVDRVYEVEVLDSAGKLLDDITWAIDNRIITFYDSYGGQLTSLPENVYSITIYYHAIPTTLSGDADESELPDQFQYAPIEYVSSKYYRRKGDIGSAKFALDTYNQLVREAKQYCNINGTSIHSVSQDLLFNTDWAAGIASNTGDTTTRTNVRIPSGPTASRPTLTTADVGYIYFDTDMSSPVWWSGTAWV